jgi:UDP-N-acetylglucosamine acyltransferase
MSNIHPAAVVEPGAKIGKNVTIEAYAVVKGSVTLEDNVVIKSFAYIDGNTLIGEGTVIWPSASIGTKTQDLKYQGEKTYVQIGKHCEIREFVTINSSCQEGSVVKIGDHCLIMAYCHVAHNCEIGNRVVMSNNAMLAGHVTLEDNVVIGGMTPIHQFCRVGRNAMVGGFSRITHDVPPYTIGAGAPYKVGGLNLIGLRRKGFTLEERKSLHQAFKITYRSGLSFAQALEAIEKQVPVNSHVTHWLDFCKNSKRGLIGLHMTELAMGEEETEDLEEILDSKV